MKIKQIIAGLFMAMTPLITLAGGLPDDPLLAMFKADKLEQRDSDEGALTVWEFYAWVGKDLNKLWVKSSGEKLLDEIESNEIDIVYSRAITPFWDVQMGLRHDFKSETGKDWAGVGFMGLAPYLFEVDANLFIDQDSVLNARLDAEYEYLFSRKVILIPNMELSLYSEDDNARGFVSGLSKAEFGLRLHYEIRRELSPYIGLSYEKQFGNEVLVENVETNLLLGLSFWF